MMIGILMCTNHHTIAQCKAKKIAKDCKPNIIKPYKYDGYAISEFTFDDKPKKIEAIIIARTFANKGF